MIPLIAPLFAFVLLFAVLTVSLDPVGAVHLVLAYLTLAVIAFNQYDHHTHGRISPLFSLQVGLAFALGAILITLVVGGLGFRRLELAAVFVLVLSFALARDDLKTFLTGALPYLAAFAVLFGIFLYHARGFASGSGMGLFPILAGIVLALNLFVIPRYVPEDVVYWSIGGLAAAVAVLGLATVVHGDFSWWLFEVRTWGGTLTPPIVGRELPIVRSIFTNPNTLGLLLFPGVTASVVATYRTLTLSSSPALAIVPAGFLALTAPVLYLSNSRASILAAAIAVCIYLLVIVTDYRIIPVALLATAVVIPTFLLGVYLSIIPINPANRFTLWKAGFEAVHNDSGLLGQGIIGTQAAIDPYLDRGGHVHNSYLSIFIRTGLLGGFVYLVLVIGPLIQSLFRPDNVNIPMLALATSFAVHQLFEGYTLYQFGPGSIIGALAVGYVIASLANGEPTTNTAAKSRWIAGIDRSSEPHQIVDPNMTNRDERSR